MTRTEEGRQAYIQKTRKLTPWKTLFNAAIHDYQILPRYDLARQKLLVSAEKIFPSNHFKPLFSDIKLALSYIGG